jgi:hypothetical protein
MPAKTARAKNADAAVFKELKKLLEPFAEKLVTVHDTETNYYLVTKSPSYKGKPMFFAAVMKKSYVSYHLMPIYWKPQLVKSISPALRKRMQGKSCFHFASVDQGLFEELAALTRRGFEAYGAAGLL